MIVLSGLALRPAFMKTLLLIVLISAPAICTFAQKSKTKQASQFNFTMEPSYWEHDANQVEFVTHRSVPAVRGKNGAYYQIFLKDQVFKNGTIEFDVELVGQGFPGINFRMSDDRKNGDNFYIRSFGPVTRETRTTLQYAAIIDGMSIWDLSDEYQSGATINQQGWNHVKLVVSGKQMKAYVNDMTKPSLVVPKLEGASDSGGISLTGNVIYANLVINPDATEGLSPDPGYISTCNDTRYLRNWFVSTPKDFPFGKDVLMPLPSANGKIQASEVPDASTSWTEVKAETRGIVNLTRKFGSVKDDARRLVWLKTDLYSSKAQERVLNFGFSDEVWMFINGQLVYVDKNYFGTPSQLSKGRCVIENTSIRLPLKEGKNEILIGLANYFYGWGIVARLDDTDGITLSPVPNN
jgi:hypothetical protein